MFNMDIGFLECRSKNNIDLIKNTEKCVIIKNNLSDFFSESQLEVEKNAFSMRSKDGKLDCTIIGNRIVINCRQKELFTDTIKKVLKEILNELNFTNIERIGIRSYHIKEFSDRDSVDKAVANSFINQSNLNIFGKGVSDLNIKFKVMKNNDICSNVSLFSSVTVQNEINLVEKTHNTKQLNVMVADLDYYTVYSNKEMKIKEFLIFADNVEKERKHDLKELERVLGE